MRRSILLFFLSFVTSTFVMAQEMTKMGDVTKDIQWIFNGEMLTITRTSKGIRPVEMLDYDQKNPAPWVKRKLKVQRVTIGKGIRNISSYAFANCTTLTDVIFESSDVREIGWGAFLGCTKLRTISLPEDLNTIGAAAFAKCSSLSTVNIPNKCRVEDMAFLSCTSLSQISIATNAILGKDVFSIEIEDGASVKHVPSKASVIKLPAYITESNCTEYGLSKEQVAMFANDDVKEGPNYDEKTSQVDNDIPVSQISRNNTYALIIGNQNYRYATDVPYAIHDARVFAEYCTKTLGIPSANIHELEDATKTMIWEEEMDWISNIYSPENKHLIVYYAGHGVPDTKNSNKAYLLPSDVRGAKPQYGISLDDFYFKLGSLNFAQCDIFLDACFSGSSRLNTGVVEGLRDVEIVPEEGQISTGNVIVFSAAQGNETAQGLDEEGHGLFTYYLLKCMQLTKGKVSLGMISDYLENSVSAKAVTLKLRKPQNPTTKASGAMASGWRDLNM